MGVQLNTPNKKKVGRVALATRQNRFGFVGQSSTVRPTSTVGATRWVSPIFLVLGFSVGADPCVCPSNLGEHIGSPLHFSFHLTGEVGLRADLTLTPLLKGEGSKTKFKFDFDFAGDYIAASK